MSRATTILACALMLAATSPALAHVVDPEPRRAPREPEGNRRADAERIAAATAKRARKAAKRAKART